MSIKTKQQARATEALTALTTTAAETYCEVTVDPKSKHVVSLELAEGELIKWQFMTESFDIAFGAVFLINRDEEHSNEVVRLGRVSSHHQEQTGSFQADHSGTLVLTWDNSYSSWR